MQLPETNPTGHVTNPQQASEFNSQRSGVMPGELEIRNSLINFDSNQTTSADSTNKKLLSMSPSYRNPITEGIYASG